MKRAVKLTYILLILGAFLVACKQTKYVPQNKYLLKKNKITLIDQGVNKDDVSEIIRQKANYKTLGFKMKLWAFNRVDSTIVANKRSVKNLKLREDNNKRLSRQNRINKKRIAKARSKGKELYTEKTVVLKDTVNTKMFFREWFKYKIGEKPIVFDSIPFNKTLDQLAIFLKNKGYYYGKVEGAVKYKRNRKAIVSYSIFSGPQYVIDSIYVLTDNYDVSQAYAYFLELHKDDNLEGKPFDKDLLNDHRDKVAKHMRDNKLYGFSSSHINFIADTTYATKRVTLGVRFTDRLVKSEMYKDSLVAVKFKETRVKNVYFHIADTINFKGNFRQTVEGLGLNLVDNNFVNTIDTLHYQEIKDAKNKSIYDTKRIATFLFNGELAIDAGLIECQNYLEEGNHYKEYYLERTFSRLMQLDLFEVIKPVIVEIPNSEFIDVHYYLVPADKQTFGFEPRATNSNGFLGVAASVNYSNKNIFGGGEKLTLSISGGFESQPPVFDKTLDGETIKKAGRSFNTFEIGPSLKLDLPGLFPAKVTSMSKRQRPRTVMSAAYNFQSRNDFDRHVFQMNYLWRFYVGKTQIFQAGLPFMSIIKFVRINNQPDFQAKLDQLNDLFLRNAYSNQFIWQDWKLTFEYNNKDKDEKKSDFSLYINSTIDPAGNTLSMFKGFQDTLNGQYTIFGVGYSQFVRMDNEIIMSNPIGSKKSIHGRLQFGAGKPYGNSATSLPYDYSFFAGGANDNRGWRARALGPGSYKYYLDTNRTATQIGDVRLGASAEFRFSFGRLLKGAVFVDAGNVWTFNDDENRPGSKFSSNWYREISLSTGIGLRMDLDFFIIRLDVGLPLTNPALPQGEKWFFQPKDQFYLESLNEFGVDYEKYVPNPYIPNFHFGIGYPF